MSINTIPILIIDTSHHVTLPRLPTEVAVVSRVVSHLIWTVIHFMPRIHGTLSARAMQRKH